MPSPSTGWLDNKRRWDEQRESGNGRAGRGEARRDEAESVGRLLVLSVEPGRGSKGETLVIRSIVQANDAMIHQHKLIRPLQLRRRAVNGRASDRLHARPRFGHQLTRDGPGPDLIGHTRFSAINFIFSPTSRDARTVSVYMYTRAE